MINNYCVVWKNGEEKGFQNRDEANRFIEKVCIPLDNTKQYQICEVF